MDEEQKGAVVGGRELDAMVAERVMGWTMFPYLMPSELADIGNALWCPPGPVHISTAAKVPEFSTDIAAAWSVVEKLVAMGLYPEIHRINDGDWRCEVRSEDCDPIDVWEDAPTAPLAISKAALLIAAHTTPHEQRSPNPEPSGDERA